MLLLLISIVKRAEALFMNFVIFHLDAVPWMVKTLVWNSWKVRIIIIKSKEPSPPLSYAAQCAFDFISIDFKWILSFEWRVRPSENERDGLSDWKSSSFLFLNYNHYQVSSDVTHTGCGDIACGRSKLGSHTDTHALHENKSRRRETADEKNGEETIWDEEKNTLKYLHRRLSVASFSPSLYLLLTNASHSLAEITFVVYFIVKWEISS